MTDDAAVDAAFAEVVVPLDGSPEAERALAPALELVRRTGVPLRLISRVLQGEEETRSEYLAGLADRHAAVTDVETQVVRRDAIPDAILEAVVPGSLVCMSSHGRSGLSRAVMGSVAEALLRSMVQPALVVGPHVAERAAALDGRVVACIDGSDASLRTLEPAQRWAGALGLPLWLVEVGEPTGKPAEWATHGDAHEGGGLASLGARTAGVTAWEVLHARHPAEALVDLAASPSDPTALLVMATHGRTGWDRLRLGSVTSATVQRSTVPVLVVPASPVPAV
jgi:nucleotide-binding universal stress UspA family protein